MRYGTPESELNGTTKKMFLQCSVSTLILSKLLGDIHTRVYTRYTRGRYVHSHRAALAEAHKSAHPNWLILFDLVYPYNEFQYPRTHVSCAIRWMHDIILVPIDLTGVVNICRILIARYILYETISFTNKLIYIYIPPTVCITSFSGL